MANVSITIFIKKISLILFLIVNSNSQNIFATDDETNFIAQVGEDLWLNKNLIPFYLRHIFANSENEGLTPRDLFGPQVSQLCVDHWSELISQLKLLQQTPPAVPATWALQMVDSWGKFPSGILSGHTSDAGDFLECVQIRGNLENERTVSNFKGLYCSTYILPNVTLAAPASKSKLESVPFDLNQNLRESVSPEELLNLTLNPNGFLLFPFVGTCFPSSCSQQDSQTFFANIFAHLTNSTLSQTIVQCQTDDKPSYDKGDISMIVILSIIGLLCLVGLLVDVLIYQKSPPASKIRKAMPIQLLVAFSLYTNTRKWMSTEIGKDSLSCLHGLRFLSMSWVVLCHTFSMVQFQLNWNLVDLKKMYNANLSMFAILNGYVAVDTFFTLSGTLVAFNLLKELDRSKGRLNVPLLYLHRYLRLTPTYMFLVGILATLLPYVSSSPFWFSIDLESKNCEVNWWHNALYVNNLISYNQDSGMCYGESWYLANDFQFFLISPFIVYPLWRWKKLGLTLLAILSVVSIATPAIITGVKDLEPTPILFRDIGTIFQDIYMKPWARIGPYLVGIFLGYILNVQSTKKTSFNMPKWFLLLGWLISSGASMGIIFGIKPYFNPAYDTNKTVGLEAAGIAYAGLHRFVWGMVISWIIFVCVHGYGGWVNKFLSWRPFIPLGRLTFCVYICSYYLQLIFHSTVFTPLLYTPYIYVNLFFAHLVMSLLLGFVLTITLESPFIHLEKLLFRPSQPPKSLNLPPPGPATEQNGGGQIS